MRKSNELPLSSTLPPIVAGPIVRHCDIKQITLWLVTTDAFDIQAGLWLDSKKQQSLAFSDVNVESAQVGTHAFVTLIQLNADEAFPVDTAIFYDLSLRLNNASVVDSLASAIPSLVYDEQACPQLAIKSSAKHVLHGSCRKPHFHGDDALIEIDSTLQQTQSNISDRPAMVIMSGDQVYVDDVAGPMLVGIHETIRLLGLFDETWQTSELEQPSDSQALFANTLMYGREAVLPHATAKRGIMQKLFIAGRQPIFTSVHAKNHLVTASEVLAMYFLVWAPQLWQLVLPKMRDYGLPEPALQNSYQHELNELEKFANGLPYVQRALAHLPVYMIFDDHDITDDWNLTRGWEEAAYNDTFATRIIGNALVGYYLCQGWGNAPEKFDAIVKRHAEIFTNNGIANHDEFVQELLDWDEWHYHLNTSPKIVVLDTRTQRWRSESNAGKPSGLMDWEALTELQQELINEPCVIMVSAAPIYGVKLIEAVQRVFTFFGNPLAVDAENWMAHKGTANVMLNIFRNRKTPPQFIILSGDVHYSFVYDVSHRFIRSSSRIVQITCSGIKNKFPERLIHILERCNYYLYGTYSPLNWFTKRRRMKIKVRRPSEQKHRTIYNGCGIGVLQLSDDYSNVEATILTPEGKVVQFEHTNDIT
ncbi:alkaline phosphatase family protein [Thalassotalea euphylliae]|uniref:alkaline phosphatase family protein n=1 Tax=Thalassotalea euphylliae TaxID=1655234 RepID=UPI00362CF447